MTVDTSSTDRNRVREVLQYQGRSQAWLARQLGVDKTRLHKALLGQRPMQPDWPEQIARLLGVHPSVLFLPSASTDVEEVSTPVSAPEPAGAVR